MTYYIHHVPGRLRIKSPMVKNSRTAKHELLNLLRTVRGIDRVTVNGVTGNCLIHYDPLVANRDTIVSVPSQTRYSNPCLAITHDEVVRRVTAKCLHALSALL